MSERSLIGWRNWIHEHASVQQTGGGAPSNFESGAPAVNLLTPPLGERAVVNGNIDIEFVWSGGRPVDVVSVLGTNYVPNFGSFRMTVTITDSNANSFALSTPTVLNAYGDFPVHMHFLVPSNTSPAVSSDIEKIRLQVTNTGHGEYDPWTSSLIRSENFHAGTLWAGPMWAPSCGMQILTRGQAITEVRRGSKTIGGQERRQPQARSRKTPISFGKLLREEVYGLDPVAQQTLQQMAAWACMSRPILALPDITDPDLMYMLGIYGYLDAEPSWRPRTNGQFESTITLTETR